MINVLPFFFIIIINAHIFFLQGEREEGEGEKCNINTGTSQIDRLGTLYTLIHTHIHTNEMYILIVV